MKAVLIGATGSTGKELLKLLLADVTVTAVTALVRRPLTVPHSKLKTHVINFDNPTEWHHLVNGDAAFSCLGTTLKAAGSKEAQYKIDYEYQYAFAKAAKENNVQKLLLISAGMANQKSVIFYSRIKGELEKAIESLGFSGLVIFRPGLLSRPQTDRPGEKSSEAIITFFNRLGLLNKMKPLPVQQLAKLMLHYAKQPQTGMLVIESKQILEEIKTM